MKPFLKFIGLLLLLSILWSCNNSKKKPTATMADSKEISKNEAYTLDDLGITIAWTAYKFTDKVGVSGTFEDYTLNKESVSGSVESILKKLKLSIPTECIDSGNAIRDFKLTTYFFEVFNTPSITGTILNAKEGEGIIRLKMNANSLKTPYTYSLQNDTIVLFTHLDLKRWKGEEALSTLNTECYELHKGTDGISKLWPDVDVTIKLPVNRTVQ
jgi:hypothetical protein